MPAAAEVRRHAPNIEQVGRRSRYQLHASIQSDDHEQARGIEHVAQLVGERRDLVDQPLGVSAGNDHGQAVHRRGARVGEQALVEAALLRRKRMVEKVVSQLKASAALQQPGRCAHVARGRPSIGQRTGVLVDAQQQQGCSHQFQTAVAVLQAFHQQRRRGPHGFDRSRPILIDG